MTFLIAIALSMAVVTLLFLDLRGDVRRIISSRNVVLFGIFVWFLLEPLKAPPELELFSQSEQLVALFCVALSLLSFLCAYHRNAARLFDSFGHRLISIEDPAVQWRFFLIALSIGVAPMLFFSEFDLMVFAEGVGVFGQRWGGVLARARYGGVRDALLELQMFLKAALPFAIVIALSPRAGATRRTIAVTFVLWMLLKAVASATRSEMIQVGLPILGGVYVSLSPRWQKRAIYTLPLLGILGYVWSAAVVVSRTTGEFAWDNANQAEYAGHEMFRELLFITSRVPGHMDHLYGLTYYTQLVNPIPRFLWPDKPTADAGLLLAQATGEVDVNGEAYLTRSPGIIGEMYWNFGLLGVVGLSAFGGMIARSWDELGKLTRDKPLAFLVYCAGLAILFLFGRSVNMSTIYGLLSLSVLLWCFTPRTAGPSA